MAIKHILVAIDGTGSSDWIRIDGRNSHVYRFYRDFLGEREKVKYYIDGPGTFGMDVGRILDDATQKLYNAIGYVLKNGANSLNEIKVNIVGHSRGAFIALKLANRLENPTEFLRITQSGSDQRVALLRNTTGTALPHIRVNFLGLYDTVKRSATELSADLTLQNVDHIAHAIRPRGRTRITFGGVDIPNSEVYNPSSGVYIPKSITGEFDTSHGGIGGDPGFFSTLRMLWFDPYCNALHLVGANEGISLDGRLYGNFSASKYGGATQNTLDQIRQYWQASFEADKFIRTHAKSPTSPMVQVPLRESTNHIPYDDSILGERLKKLIVCKHHLTC